MSQMSNDTHNIICFIIIQIRHECIYFLSARKVESFYNYWRIALVIRLSLLYERITAMPFFPDEWLSLLESESSNPPLSLGVSIRRTTRFMN